MASIAQVAKAMRTVLTTTAHRAARATGFVQRRSKLTGAKCVQTLVFGWLANPEASYEELAQTAATLGVGISPQGLEQRFTAAAAQGVERVLAAAVQPVIAAAPVALPLLRRFSAVYSQDSSQVQLPAGLAPVWAGSGGGAQATDQTAALKLQVRLDLTRGGLDGPFLAAGRSSERASAVQHAPVRAGSLRLADLGYFALDTLAHLAHQRASWLTRRMAGTQVYDAHGHVLDLPATLGRHGAAVVELSVCLGVHPRLPARLIAVRVRPEVGDQRRRELPTEARHRGQAVSQERRRVADGTLFCTNVPPPLLSGPEVLVVARVRWQIELLCKLWKSAGHLAHSRSAQPWRVLGEVYAKLLGLVVQHWILLTSLWRYPDRSAWKAAHTLRHYALPLATAFVQGAGRLAQALAGVRRTLVAGCRLNKRKQAPCTFQRLLALTNGVLA